MSVFLDVSIDRFSLAVFDGQAKFGWIIVLLLAPLQVKVKRLQLVQKVINDCYSVDLGFLGIGLKLRN